MVALLTKPLSRRSGALFAVTLVFLVTAALIVQRSSFMYEDGPFFQRMSGGSPVSKAPADPKCDGFPDTSNILLIMKTGASEAFNKIPMQLATTLRCVPETDFLILSDAEQEINGLRIYDCLDEIVEQVMDSNPDFDIYRRQKECLIDLETCNRFGNATAEGLVLDKYKNLHMAAKAYKIRPKYDWYVFVDADSFVSWTTLVEWLKNMDPTQELYFGSAARIGQFPFAAGGSGYGLSNALAKKLFGGRRALSSRWDFEIMDSCCGDVTLGMFIEDMAEVTVQDMWPTNNDDKPTRIGYGEEQWCHPVATMHGITGQELSILNAWERERGLAEPLRIRDLYFKFVEELLQPIRQDWDNLSEDVYYLDLTVEQEDKHKKLAKVVDLSPIERKAHVSFNACQQTCASHPECFQYRFHQGVCSIGRSFSLGRPMKKEMRMGDKWLSGWDMDKIKAWIEAHQECGEMVWPQGSTPYIPQEQEERGGLVG